MDKLFFSLIRVAIGTQDTLPHAPSAEEWKQLYDMAKKQSLVGICFAALQKLSISPLKGDLEEASKETFEETPEPIEVLAKYWNMPEMLYLKWMGMAAKIQQRNEVVNQQCVELQNRLAKDGLQSFLMKGQCNAALYDELNALRQSGDIDVFVDGGREHVVDYVMRTAPTSVINEIELEYKIFPDTEVDMHHSLNELRNPFRNKKLRAFLESYKDANYTSYRLLPMVNKSVPCPVWEYDMVFQLVHIYSHLVSRGVGFRQLMDYYFLLKNAPNEANSMAVQKCIEEIGLSKFACGLMWILQHVFGLSMIGVPWTPNIHDGKYLLEEVLVSGNFGQNNERMQNLSKLNRFWVVTENTIRYYRFDHWAWFWSPMWRIYHYLWKITKGYKK